jgi:hypothetical protein
MAIRITEVHLEGGELHEHIASLRWHADGGYDKTVSSRSTMVEWLEKSTANQAFTEPPFGTGAVVQVKNNGRITYLQTIADGVWTNNLLALPRF